MQMLLGVLLVLAINPLREFAWSKADSTMLGHGTMTFASGQPDTFEVHPYEEGAAVLFFRKHPELQEIAQARKWRAWSWSIQSAADAEDWVIIPGVPSRVVGTLVLIPKGAWRKAGGDASPLEGLQMLMPLLTPLGGEMRINGAQFSEDPDMVESEFCRE